MPPLPSYFDDFLKQIKLQPDLRADLQEAHRELEDRLGKDTPMKPILVDSFLQGSYKRSTIIDPDEGDVADVDVVVVTGIDERRHPEPQTAMDLFAPFLDRNYRGKWEPQDRSFGIKVGRIKMDMVITSAPSQVVREMIAWRAVKSQLTLEDDREFRLRRAWREPAMRATKGDWQMQMERDGDDHGAWSADPLRIPDRTRRCWEPTHPLAQIEWASEKNRRCDGWYIDVVRALKWWRRQHPTPKYPKGYPLEALVGDACPDGITSVAEGVVRTLETLNTRWVDDARDTRTPYMKDHGVEQNVLARVSGKEFAQFHALVGPAARTARQAYDCESKYDGVELWQQLFGGRFPDTPDGGPGGRGPDTPKTPTGGFTPRKEPGLIGGGRFA